MGYHGLFLWYIERGSGKWKVEGGKCKIVLDEDENEVD
jgi:hypothetical protein